MTEKARYGVGTPDFNWRILKGLVGKDHMLSADTVLKPAVRAKNHVIDLRSAADFDNPQTPPLQGAINMPYDRFAEDFDAGKLPTANGKPYIFVCYTGHTSTWVAGILYAIGYDAYSMKFGMNALHDKTQ